MRQLKKVLQTEILKVKKAKIFWITIIFFSFITIIISLMMFILKNPELASNMGLLGAKAQIIGEANWESYFKILAQIIALGGLIGFGFITTWIFGREFSDKTIDDLLSLPISRTKIVTIKFIIMFVWNLLLILLVLLIGILGGVIVGLEELTKNIMFSGIQLFLITSGLTILLSTFVAFFASYGRGYLLPLGYVISTMVLSQIAAALGHGAYLPWSIPALFSGAAGPEQVQMSWFSYLLVIVFSVLGYIFTVQWWNKADHN